METLLKTNYRLPKTNFRVTQPLVFGRLLLFEGLVTGDCGLAVIGSAFEILSRFYKGGEENMAVRIRLRRMGAKKSPFYRVVVADSRAPRDGRFIDIIGYYHPTTQPATVKLDEDKALDWLGKGAQPSETVRSLLKGAGVMAKYAALKNQ